MPGFPKEWLLEGSEEASGVVDDRVNEVGKRADFLLLTEDPTLDIRATRSIRGYGVAALKFLLLRDTYSVDPVEVLP
jgi:hypothetical protein